MCVVNGFLIKAFTDKCGDWPIAHACDAMRCKTSFHNNLCVIITRAIPLITFRLFSYRTLSRTSLLERLHSNVFTFSRDIGSSRMCSNTPHTCASVFDMVFPLHLIYALFPTMCIMLRFCLRSTFDVIFLKLCSN